MEMWNDKNKTNKFDGKVEDADTLMQRNTDMSWG